MLIMLNTLILAELPSYQCKEAFSVTYFNYKGKIKPEIEKSSGKSRLNISLVPIDGQIKYMRVNGQNLLVTKTFGSYVYALEFALSGMHTWVLFNNNFDGKNYLTISKTYDMLGSPMAGYFLYSCEKVNNTFY